MRSVLFPIGIGMLALGCASYEPISGDEPISEQEAALLSDQAVIAYPLGAIVPESELIELDPVPFGGIVGDDVTWLGRIDVAEDGLVGGVWQASRGSFSVLCPGALHGTVHAGHMIVSDEAGSHLLGPGDAFLVTKGTLIEYEVPGPMVQASFLGNFNSPDAEASITAYKKGSGIASDDEMVDMGGPENFNATVLDGELTVQARVDYLAGPEFAGIFQATRSTVILDPVIVTEHGTVLRNGMTITGDDGVSHRLKAGDSFIIRRGSRVLWEIQGPYVQESFFSIKAQ